MNPSKATDPDDFTLDARRDHLSEAVELNRQAILKAPSYKLAEYDVAVLKRPEQRPLRIQLELQKTEQLLQEHKIDGMVVVFGGTQIIPKKEAEQRLAKAEEELAANPKDERLKRAVFRTRKQLEKSFYYDHAREFAKIVSTSCQSEGKCEFVVTTGGGPGIMEAGNRGAYDVGAKNIGLNIELPHEQEPNPFITPELCFQFHYFAMRKFHFILRAKAL